MVEEKYLGILGREGASVIIATLEASLLTAGRPSSARDASMIRESILGVIQAMRGRGMLILSMLEAAVVE